MKNKEEVNLIDGTFTPEDARELLLELVNNKIHFHELKNFSSKERFGQEDALATIKIPKLVKSKEILKTIINLAQTENKKLKIHSTISIEIE